ncbi:Gramicidin S synthetase 1 [Erwinia amylovora Ea644]|uniref:condensation domain-containing protein n=1 Tax=Erwinia amylovora TaxID=552 RepID=UPI0002CAF691|nr:condensation domain-containing protein [Erwinia amylovora]CCP01747.1 Gramicidin S synthetase 1 [Erwinia amylovora Ea644]CCP05755.1 Gramicidin S synthetase 1 [Erwinia amylovora MR1]
MRLFLGQLYDISTTRQPDKLCVGDVLVPSVRLNADALDCAINFLLHKFSILRASFLYQNDELSMHFCHPQDLPAGRVFQVYPAAQGALPLRQQLISCIDKVRASMSLDSAPLLRYCLFDAECAHAQRLLIIFNHLVCDGISSRILWRELSAAYQSLLAGDPLLFRPCTTYMDFAQELIGRRDRLDDRLSSPIPVAPGCDLLDQLTHGQACTATLAEVVHREISIGGADLSALRARAAAAGVALSVFLLACWINTLSRVQSTGTVTLLMWVSPHFIGDWSTPVSDLVGSVSFPLPVVFSLNERRTLTDTVKTVSEELQRGLLNAEDFAARYFAGGTQSGLPVLPSIGFNFVSDQRLSPLLIGYELAPEGIRIERLPQELFDLALGMEIELCGQQMHVSLSATPFIAGQLSLDELLQNLLARFE